MHGKVFQNKKNWESIIAKCVIIWYGTVRYGKVRLVRRTEDEKYGTLRTFEQYSYSLVPTEVDSLNLDAYLPRLFDLNMLALRSLLIFLSDSELKLFEGD